MDVEIHEKWNLHGENLFSHVNSIFEARVVYYENNNFELGLNDELKNLLNKYFDLAGFVYQSDGIGIYEIQVKTIRNYARLFRNLIP